MEKLFNYTDIKFIFLFSIKDLFRSKAKLLSISITLFLSLFIYSTILTINLSLNKELSMTKSELAAVKAKIDGIFATYANSGLSLQESGGRLYVTTSVPVKYRSSSARLNREQRAAIDALAETLIANPAVKILIEGNTDNKKFKAGSGSDNWDLSYRRAKAVAKRLIRKGVNPAQLAVVGRADTQPAADNSTADGRAENRRTVITPDPDLGVLKN